MSADVPADDLLTDDLMPEGAVRSRYRDRVIAHRFLEPLALLGLAGVYLVNSIVAILQPDDFRRLIGSSELTKLLRMDGFHSVTVLIAVNDGLIAVALLAALWAPRWRLPVFAWSGLWLLAVAMIKVFALEAVVG
jgi:hypothetical protein